MKTFQENKEIINEIEKIISLNLMKKSARSLVNDLIAVKNLVKYFNEDEVFRIIGIIEEIEQSSKSVRRELR